MTAPLPHRARVDPAAAARRPAPAPVEIAAARRPAPALGAVAAARRGDPVAAVPAAPRRRRADWRCAGLPAGAMVVGLLGGAPSWAGGGDPPPCEVIGYDDFDGNGHYLSRTLEPDLTGGAPPGAFPSSPFDVFGPTDRSVNAHLADDSVSIEPGDDFGVVGEGESGFFGVEDVVNPDNPLPHAAARWTFDVTGARQLRVRLRAAAMGDFEAADTFTFLAALDDQPPQVLFSLSAREQMVYTYTMADGQTTRELDDPLALDEPNNPEAGPLIVNDFLWLDAPVIGSGDVLTISFITTADGSFEVFAFDDLTICGTFGDHPPVADAGPDQLVVDSDRDHFEAVRLDGSASYDLDGSITSYDWDTDGDGQFDDAMGTTPTVEFPLGISWARLRVTSDDGDFDTDEVQITVLPDGTPPFADAGVPQELHQSVESIPESVVLNASGSYDHDGSIVSYNWFAYDTFIASGVHPTVTLGAGLHHILLETTDDAGHTSRDATFVKILPPGTFARYDFDSNLGAAMTLDPPAGTFTSETAAFGPKQRGVSANLPAAALDDSGTADPNRECSPDPTDRQGVIPCAKRDAFFAAVNLHSPANPLCNAGVAAFTFDIRGRRGIEVWLDVGASGDFEAGAGGGPGAAGCEPGAPDAGLGDRFDWTWAIDNGAEHALLRSAVDEDASYVQTFFSGAQRETDDPLLLNGVVVDNALRTHVARVVGEGETLTLRLRARCAGVDEAFVFDDIVLRERPAETCPGDCDGSGRVDVTDLGLLLAGFNELPGPCDTDGSGATDISDLGSLLAAFDGPCAAAP